jgi:hypothetical protein
MKNQKTNWWLDVVLYAGFIATFVMDVTGLELHQWIGIGIGVFLLLHLFLHWKWVCTVLDRFFRCTSWRARFYLLIDGLLAAGFFTILWTGLLISTWLNITFINYDFWKTIHIIVSVGTMFLIILKVILHRKWIVKIADNQIFKRNEKALNPLPSEFKPARQEVNRREFLKISGVVGVASILGVSQMSKLIQFAAADQKTDLESKVAYEVENQVATQMSAPTVPIAQTQVYQESANVSASNAAVAEEIPALAPTIQPTQRACVIRCSKGCSFPGRCRKYVDANGNDLCDLGECL